jgi:hypothetical protein
MPVDLQRLPGHLARHISEDGDCWRWTGPMACGRYPLLNHAGRSTLARRALWALVNGPIPAGLILRCTCGLGDCVNLEHMRLTTYRSVAKEVAALGGMSGRVRAARIAAAKRRAGKLSAAAAAEIRYSDEPVSVLAKRHGVSKTWAHRIRAGVAWREYASPWAGLER